MKKSILNILLQQTQRELLNHPEYYCFPHWTFILDDNDIVSVGMNRKKSPPIWLGYPSKGESTSKWHSELDAIYKLRKPLDSFTAINIRLNRKGEPKMSMPCKCCMKLLQVNRCKRVFFTTNDKWGQL